MTTADLIGIVTLTDVLQLHPDQRATTKVGSIMTKEIITTHPDDTLYTAFDKMTNNQIGRLLLWNQQKLEANGYNYARRRVASLQRRNKVKTR